MAKTKGAGVANYTHADKTSPMRPEVGVQGQFKKKKPAKKYRYDSSLAPELNWDGQNPAREKGEALLAEIERGLAQARDDLAKEIAALDPKLPTKDLLARIESAKSKAETRITRLEETARKLKAMSRPFLDWAGKAERLSFEVPTLPLFIHERLSTRGIIETLKSHRRDRQEELFDPFGDPKHSIADQLTKAYEYQDEWRNRMILGDSLVVMNSLLHWDQLGGKVQMIYLDPPYGVKFGSNFQPFVRKRDVKHNDDADMTREPEMVQAYRDTWELRLHSYLTYLRDRLLLARELLHPSGSIFVQISDENLHHVREVMDEVFGAENFVGVIPFLTTTSQTSEDIGSVADYLIWFAKNRDYLKYQQLYVNKDPKATGGWGFNYIEEKNGTRRPLSKEERRGEIELPIGRLYRLDNLTSQGTTPTGTVEFVFNGKKYHPGPRNHWKTTIMGMDNLTKARRIQESFNQIQYVRFFDDFAVQPITNLWTDTTQAGFVDAKLYAVQTVTKIVERCILMTTDPGDLILDPTCGSGTTAYVAEQWGRRWITIDTSRVPLALARQRLLTATFHYYELKDEAIGPSSGFVYKCKQNKKGEEVGGIVPHITLKSIANNEPPQEEVLVDRPEVKNGIVRVTGPFTFDATIPTPLDAEMEQETEPVGGSETDGGGSFVERMIEVLRKSPLLRLDGNRAVTFKTIRQPAKTMWLSAEAMIDASALTLAPSLQDVMQEAREQNANLLPMSQRPVAIVFGPENGAVSERLVFEASREAQGKNYAHLYVIGFAIQPNAREFIEQAEQMGIIPATYVQATPDLLMGDLLKNMRSSQIFSVCGLPEVRLRKMKKDGVTAYQVELLGLDVFNPVTMEVEHRRGDDVPAWFLDTDYNGNCFYVRQAFFPRTSAWDNLKKSLKGYYDEDVWSHLAGTTSAPFAPGDERRVAVKVIDDRGNELMVVKDLKEASQERGK